MNVHPANVQYFKKSGLIILFTIQLLFFVSICFGQSTTIFSDNFNRKVLSPGGTPSMTYTSTFTGSGSTIGTDLISANTTDSTLRITSGSASGRSYVMGAISTFNAADYKAVLNTNVGLVTWTFNMRQTRVSAISSLTGFDNQPALVDASNPEKFGIATILVCDNANPLDPTAKGYAVAMGASGSDTSYNLISFTGGLTANSNCTRLIKGIVLSNIKDVVSIKVTYNPADNKWNMYQADGVNSGVDVFPDPATFTSSILGTVVNTAYVATTMVSFGYLWNYAASVSQNAYFDNFKIVVNKPEIVISFPTPATINDFMYVGAGPSPTQFFNFTGAYLSGTVTVTAPTDYLICATFNGTFTTSLTYTATAGTITSAIVYIKLKGGLAVGTYNNETITLTSNNAGSKTVTVNGTVLSASPASAVTLTPVAPMAMTFPATEFGTSSSYQMFALSATNIGANTVITFFTTNNFFVTTLVLDNFGFPINPGTSATLTADANGNIAGKYVFVRYTPNAQVGGTGANPASAIDANGYQSGTLTYQVGAAAAVTAATLKGKIASYYFRGGTTKMNANASWSANKNDLTTIAFATNNPTNPFAIPGVNFKIITDGHSDNNTNMSSGGLTISGAGSKLVIGDPSFPGVTYTFPSNFATSRPVVVTMDIDSASTGSNVLKYQDGGTPTFTFGTFHKTSEFHYQASNTHTANNSFGKLFIESGSTLTVSNSPSIQNCLIVDSTSTLTTINGSTLAKISMLTGAIDSIKGTVIVHDSAGISCVKCTPNSGGAAFNFVDGTSKIVFGNNSLAHFARTGNQQLQPHSYSNLQISNSGTKTLDSLNGTTKIGYVANKLTVGNSGTSSALSIPFNNLTLQSTSTRTAVVTPVFGTITGKVTVERYLQSKKGWRFLSSPTKHDGNTIKESWMEGGVLNNNPVAGYGIQITSNRGTWQTDGFDAYTVSPSLKTYDPANNTWVGVTSTNTAMEVGKGYMTFVRGNRSVTAVGQASTSTVVRENGSLNVGTVNYNNLGTATNQFVGIGNPYAAAINPSNFSVNNLDKAYYVWDPLLTGVNGLGAFQTISVAGLGNVSITPGGGSYAAGNKNIESGAGFFVHTNGGAGSLILAETDKVDTSRLVSRVMAETPSLRTNLFKIQNGDTALTDGVLNLYSNDFSDVIDIYDAVKLYNASENISIKSNNEHLSIERRNGLQPADTIFYEIKNVAVGQYQFEITPEFLESIPYTAYLEDLYLNSHSTLSLSNKNIVTFSIDNNPASYDVNRFRIIFKLQNLLPVTFTNIRAVKSEKNILVSWYVQNEINIHHYNIEKSVDGIHFAQVGTMQSNHQSNYTWLDEHAASGFNYYRIRSVENSGEVILSSIAKVLIEAEKAMIIIYPNPVKINKSVYFDMKNITSGFYQIDLYNMLGEKLETRNYNKDNTSQQLDWKLSTNILPGKYYFIVSDKGNSNNFSQRIPLICL